jgi:peptidoglycan/xylan/chitin deacetylase (PgdA/CDA1 family)
MRMQHSLIALTRLLVASLVLTLALPAGATSPPPTPTPTRQQNATAPGKKSGRSKRRKRTEPAQAQPAQEPAQATEQRPAQTKLSAPAKEPVTSGYSKTPTSGFGQLGYTSVNVDGPFVALTFDDGPHATNTPRLLKILADKGVKATFFVVGQCAQEYPEIMRQIAAEGHELANHSWSHPNFAKMSDAGVKSQIDKTADIIRETTGATTTLLRPPYGAVTTRQRRWLRDELDLKLIFWSVDPLDWKRPGPSVVAKRIASNAAPGGIILAHDIHAGTVDAMDQAIDELKARGYRFVTVSELIAMEKKTVPQVASAAPLEPPQAPPTPTPATQTTIPAIAIPTP